MAGDGGREKTNQVEEEQDEDECISYGIYHHLYHNQGQNLYTYLQL
jgi:hypothetical protein